MHTGTIAAVIRRDNSFVVLVDSASWYARFLILEDRGGLQVGGKVRGALDAEGEQQLTELTSGQAFRAYGTGRRNGKFAGG